MLADTQPPETRRDAPTIWILYASTGRGHQRAAEAVTAALRRSHTGCSVQLFDILELTEWPLAVGYRVGYSLGVKRARAVYRFLYERWRAPEKAQASPLLRFAPRFADPLAARMAGAPPAMVVSTHFLGSYLADHLRTRGLWKGPLWQVVTDFRPHGFQVMAGIERYLIPSPEAAEVLRRYGIAPDALSVTGIPCSEEFRRVGERRATSPRPRGPRRVLFLGHGLTATSLVPWVRRLAEAREVRLTVAGISSPRLEACLRWLTARAANAVEVHGLVDFLPRLMAEADLVVGKAGGLTCSEAMDAGVPMALCLCYPGQEEENRDYLVERGAAAAVTDPREVRELAMDPGRLESLARGSRRLGRADAASSIVRLALGRLGLDERRTGGVPGAALVAGAAAS